MFSSMSRGTAMSIRRISRDLASSFLIQNGLVRAGRADHDIDDFQLIADAIKLDHRTFRRRPAIDQCGKLLRVGTGPISDRDAPDVLIKQGFSRQPGSFSGPDDESGLVSKRSNVFSGRTPPPNSPKQHRNEGRFRYTLFSRLSKLAGPAD